MSEFSHESMDTATPAGGRTCPNCGRDRPESFCPRCGQSDRDYARSLRSVAGEFLRETFELDSRLFRTLKLLLFRPGSLTREFSRNRRVSFMSPVRLYIFASFAYFLLLSVVGGVGQMAVEVAEEDRETTVPLAPTEERLAAFKAVLPPDRQRKVDDILGRPEDDFGRETILFWATTDFGGQSWIERLIVLGTIDYLHDPSVMPRRFLANMPVAMFCLLPVLGLVLAAFHFRKKRFYVEHLVFAIHIQTFTFFVYAGALFLPGSGPGGWIRLGCLLVPYPYLVMALKRYYENGWVLTVAKSVGVTMLYALVLLPAFLISILVTG